MSLNKRDTELKSNNKEFLPAVMRFECLTALGRWGQQHIVQLMKTLRLRLISREEDGYCGNVNIFWNC